MKAVIGIVAARRRAPCLDSGCDAKRESLDAINRAPRPFVDWNRYQRCVHLFSPRARRYYNRSTASSPIPALIECPRLAGGKP
jgi:hypothetical protein